MKVIESPDITLTIKNYRSFVDSSPATVVVRGGITAILGPNNAGKSSLLRFFFDLRDHFLSLTNADALAGTNFQPVNRMRQIENTEFFANSNEREMSIRVSLSGSERAAPIGGSSVDNTIPKSIDIFLPRNAQGMRLQYNLDDRKLDGAYLQAGGTNQSFGPQGFQTQKGNETIAVDVRPYQRAFALLSDAIYIGPFRNAVNVGTKDDYFDLSIGEAFIKKWRDTKQGQDRRLHESARKITDDLQAIFGFRSLEINPSNNDQTVYFIVDGKSYRANELGAGISQFLLVLATVASRKPAMLLIDEPELHLHSTLQSAFLTSIASYTGFATIFASHSPGLARAAADYIYVVSKTGDASRIRDIEATESVIKILPELAFSHTPEIGASMLLLVEGQTDIRVFQQFLRKLHLDHKVLPLHIGGGAMMKDDIAFELRELRRIGVEIFAVVDSDRKSASDSPSAAALVFKKACDAESIACHILDRHSTESYFSRRAIDIVYTEAPPAFGPFEKAPKGWQKGLNWRIAREMRLDELEGTDLLDFLRTLDSVRS
jgi:ABC-type branched-subunit amino acid transport system ATPase component